MKTRNFLRTDPRESVNSASCVVEVVTRKPRGASMPHSSGLTGVKEMRGVVGRVASYNRAERRASEAQYRKQEPELVSTKKLRTGVINGGVWTSDPQPQIIQRQRVSVLQPDERQPLDFLLGSSIHGRWTNVLDTVEEWSLLEEGWDGEEADALSEEILRTVKSFIAVAERYGVAEPRPYISADGEVGFIWDGEKKASVTFTESDRFLAFCPRAGMPDMRLAGPLDVAICSPSLFESLREHTAV